MGGLFLARIASVSRESMIERLAINVLPVVGEMPPD